MAGRRLFSKSLAFSAPSRPPLRHHSAADAAISAGTRETNVPKPAVPISQSDSVLGVLQSRGLAAGDIAGFASRGLLEAKLDRNLGAKFDLLLGLGFSASDVAKLLQKSNLMSFASLASLKKRIEFLKSVVDDVDGVMTIIKRAIWTITGSAAIEKRVADNIAVLKKLGIPDKKIKYFMVSYPRFFQKTSQSIVAAAERAQKEFGVARDSKMLIYHVFMLSSQLDSTRQAKIRVFERFGWQNSDVHTLARSYPLCFTLSAARLEKGLEFFMNTAGFSPSDIASNALILGMSLERRVSPRYHLIQALKSKCLIPKNLSFSRTLGPSKSDFCRKFVDKFAELEPDACKAYMMSVTSAQKN